MWHAVCTLLIAGVAVGSILDISDRVDSLLRSIAAKSEGLGNVELPDLAGEDFRATDITVDRVSSWRRVGEVLASMWTPSGHRESGNITAVLELDHPAGLRVGHFHVWEDDRELDVPLYFTVAKVRARLDVTILDHNREDSCRTVFTDFRITRLKDVRTHSRHPEFDDEDMTQDFRIIVMPFINKLLVKHHFTNSLSEWIPLCPFF